MSKMETNRELRVAKDTGDLFEKLANDRGIDVYLCLLENPSTAGELSTRLHMTRAKINYLLDCLLQEDLISLHAEKKTGSTIEKCYAAKAETFHLLTGSGSSESQQLKTLFYILDVMKENMMHAIRRQSITQLGMSHVKIKRDRLHEYIEKMKELQREFDQSGTESELEESEWFTMVQSVFPGPNLQ